MDGAPLQKETLAAYKARCGDALPANAMCLVGQWTSNYHQNRPGRESEIDVLLVAYMRSFGVDWIQRQDEGIIDWGVRVTSDAALWEAFVSFYYDLVCASEVAKPKYHCNRVCRLTPWDQ